MATTESRPGFRLPWSADRAPSRDDSEDSAEVGASAAAANGWGFENDTDSGAPTDAGAAVAEAEAPALDDQVTTPAAPVAPETPAAAPGAHPAPGWRPTKFLVDMTHAMQAAAEQARATTLEQFRIEGSSFVEQIQGRSAAETDALRRRAESDVVSIKDWSKAEIARVREETEGRIAGRRGQLDGQLSRHAALVEREVARIEGQIAAFEAEMAAFFDELLAETDLTVLAARAQQMPEAPAFDQLDETAFTELMTEPAVGVPVARPEPVAEMTPAAPADEPPTDTSVAPPATATPAGDQPFDRDVAMAAIQADAEAAASAEAAPAEGAPDQGAADAPAEQADDAPANDPRLAMLGLTPDFAAAEAAAAEAVATEIPELDEENLVARLAGLIPPSTHGAPAEASQVADGVSTQVVVTGLVSVASIASFKRHLSRSPGVRHVGVSSGPDGEFLFTVQHDAEVSLRDVIPTLPGFQARVTGGGDGVVTASAQDPED